MRTVGALGMLVALAYLIWRMQTRRVWIERVPLVLDVALAMGLAAFGIGALTQGTIGGALAQGVRGAGEMAAALGLVHLVAWIVGKIPGCSGIRFDLELPVGERDDALRWLRHRLIEEGFRLEPERGGADLVAYQGGNPSAWDRRIRPKRLWATLTAGGAAGAAVAHLRVRYVPPAIGLDGPLRSLIEAMLVEGAPVPPERSGTRSGDWFPLEFLVIAGFLIFFAMMSFYRW